MFYEPKGIELIIKFRVKYNNNKYLPLYFIKMIFQKFLSRNLIGGSFSLNPDNKVLLSVIISSVINYLISDPQRSMLDYNDNECKMGPLTFKTGIRQEWLLMGNFRGTQSNQ